MWIIGASRDPAPTALALKGVKFMDHRIANPAYGVPPLTGLLMMLIGRDSLTTLWIDIALILLVVLILVAVVVYTPALREQVKLAEAGDTSSDAFTRLGARGQISGQALAVIVLAMMVFKPTI